MKNDDSKNVRSNWVRALINTCLNKLNIFLHPDLLNEPLQNKVMIRVLVFLALFLTFLNVLSFVFLAQSAFGKFNWIDLTGFFTLLAGSLGVLLIIRVWGFYKSAGILLCFSLWLALTIGIYAEYSSLSPALVWLGIIPLLSLFFSGARVGIVFFLLVLTTLVYFSSKTAVIPVIYNDLTGFTSAYSFACFLSTITVYLFAYFYHYVQQVTERENKRLADDASWIAQKIKEIYKNNTEGGLKKVLKDIGEYLDIDIVALQTEASLSSIYLNWNRSSSVSLEEIVADYTNRNEGGVAYKEAVANLSEDRCFDLNDVDVNNIPVLNRHFNNVGVSSYLFVDLHGGDRESSFIDVVSIRKSRVWTSREKYILRMLGEAMAMVALGIKKQERIDLALEASKNGIWDVDLLTDSLYVSQSLANILGYQQNEIPKNDHDFKRNFYSEEDYNASLDQDESQPSREVLSAKVQVRHKSGKYIWVESKYLYTNFDSEGKPRRCVGVLSDISSFKDYEHELELARNTAEEASASKSAFLANMSHEIRTPMNSVLGFLSIALDSGRLPDDLAKHIRTSHGSAQSLLVIINDILDISKFENGNVSLEKLDFKLYDALVSSVEMQESLCLKKNLSLSLTYHPQLSTYYRGDPTRLKQVLINLLGNSVKFTEKGSVSIEVEPADKPGWLHFMIKDTGVGIAPDRLSSIFDSFTQADESTTRRFGGTGLGTTISKQIVEAMEGRIWVESELDKGSIFHFEIHMEAVAEEDVIHTYQEFGHDTTAPEKPERCYRVLLVDDIEQNLELGNIRFTELGHTVDFASNGSEAVEAYQKNHYDVILMDIQMPVMDGLEATRIIRDLEKRSGKTVPIIALTASVLQEDLDLCYSAGMNDIVGKPINFNELFAAIDQVLEESDQQSVALSSKAPNFGERESNLLELMPLAPVADVESALKTWRKADLYLKNLNKFIESNQESIEELPALIENYQFTDVIRLAHGLKGVAGNLSLQGIYESADTIDKTAEDLSNLTGGKTDDLDKIRLLKEELNIHCLNLSNEYNKAKELIQTVVKNSSESNTTDDVSNTPDKISLDVPQLKIKLTRLQETLQSGSVSDELLDECLQASSNYVDKNLINQVQSNIDDFDFEAAEKFIVKILSHLD